MGPTALYTNHLSLTITPRVHNIYRVARKSKLLYCVNSLLFWATLYTISDISHTSAADTWLLDRLRWWSSNRCLSVSADWQVCSSSDTLRLSSSMCSHCTTSAATTTTTNPPHRHRITATANQLPAAEVICPSGLRSSDFDVDVIFITQQQRNSGAAQHAAPVTFVRQIDLSRWLLAVADYDYFDSQ